jgi:hypothetical protein
VIEVFETAVELSTEWAKKSAKKWTKWKLNTKLLDCIGLDVWIWCQCTDGCVIY